MFLLLYVIFQFVLVLKTQALLLWLKDNGVLSVSILLQGFLACTFEGLNEIVSAVGLLLLNEFFHFQ